jgi:hypothetical protein
VRQDLLTEGDAEITNIDISGARDETNLPLGLAAERALPGRSFHEAIITAFL